MNYLVVALTPTSRIESTCFDRASAITEYQNMLSRGYPSYIKKISGEEATTREDMASEVRAQYA